MKNVEELIHLLLRNAELIIPGFDRNCRTEMGFNGRRLPFYVMSYHKEGTAKLRIDRERVYEIPAKSVMLVPPYLLHDHYKDSRENTEFMYWHFTFMIDRVFDALRFFQIPVVFPLKNYRRFEEAFALYVEDSTTVKNAISWSRFWRKRSPMNCFICCCRRR